MYLVHSPEPASVTMQEPQPKLNMRQVAALAGVSHQTVSRVLNGHASIRPETRAKVLSVIDEVNYRPNLTARALATSKSNRIGVILDSAVEYGPSSTLRAVEHSARATGYSVSSVTLDGDNESLGLDVALEHLMAQGIDALCVIAPRSSSLELIRKRASAVPVLVVKAEPDQNFLTTSVDQELGATLAVRHLYGLGHRAIAHLAGPLDWFDARGRHAGWKASLEAEQLDVLEPVIGDWTADFAYEIARTPGKLPECTAVFAANDQMALGLIHGFAERGVVVPNDVSVVGFDDLPEAKHFLPPLTTIRQDFADLGARSVEVLHAALVGEAPPSRSLIAPELVIRRSTAAPGLSKLA